MPRLLRLKCDTEMYNLSKIRIILDVYQIGSILLILFLTYLVVVIKPMIGIIIIPVVEFLYLFYMFYLSRAIFEAWLNLLVRNKQVEISYVNNVQVYVANGEISTKLSSKPVVIYNAIVPTGLPVIIITRQYLELLNNEELMAVIKHEYAHISNKDYLSAYIVLIPYILITFLPITIYLIKYLRIGMFLLPVLIIIYIYFFLVVIRKQYNIAEREADLYAVKAV